MSRVLAVRSAPTLFAASLLAGAMGVVGCGTPPEPSSAGKTEPPATTPEDKANDCRALATASKAFPTPESDRPSAAEIKRGYEKVAAAFQATNLKNRELADLAKRATVIFQELAARAPALEKDFLTLETAIASAREQNSLAENIGNEIGTLCETMKTKAAECPPLTKAIESRPVLSRKDLVSMSDYVRRLKAFQTEVKAVETKNTQVAGSVRRLDEAYTELDVRLTRMEEAATALRKDGMTDESDALSEKMETLCQPPPSSRGAAQRPTP